MRSYRILLLLVGLAGCHTALADTEAVRPLDDAISHTVLLKDPGCTGVRIGGGLVVTAKHCMGSRHEGDRHSGMTVGYISPDHDFAVLKGDAPIMSVWLRDAKIGQHVYAIGFPVSIDDGKQHLTVTDGIVAGPADSEDQERITAYAYYGNSGGGVWGDGGEVVGILVEIRPSGTADGGYPVPMPAHSYMVPISFVRDVVLR